jgi:hypothetical protein
VNDVLGYRVQLAYPTVTENGAIKKFATVFLMSDLSDIRSWNTKRDAVRKPLCAGLLTSHFAQNLVVRKSLCAGLLTSHFAQNLVVRKSLCAGLLTSHFAEITGRPCGQGGWLGRRPARAQETGQNTGNRAEHGEVCRVTETLRGGVISFLRLHARSWRPIVA